MVKSANDSRIVEQKDRISQLNMAISGQNELVASLRSTVEECNSTISSLREQVDYLTQKLFGTSSEKSKTIAGQLNLFDEAEQEAHLRRYFVDAVSKGEELDYSTQAVQYCNKLFDYERQSCERGHTFEQRKEYRLQKEKPVLDAFWTWISAQVPKKGTRLEKAVNYAQNHKEQFLTYLGDGRCSFSNNLSENSIRPFTAGCKNWLFSDTPKGAEASAAVYTMVEMAKAHGLNIYIYLKYLLERLAGTKMTDSALSKLAPWDQDVIAGCPGAM